MIEEIHLTSFKGFRDFTLKCSPFTILVGPNSSGKTSILQAIQFLHQMAMFVFGDSEEPNFASPRWSADPTGQIQRLHSGDPDAIWLHKNTSEQCSISLALGKGYAMSLEIKGRGRYEFDLLRQGASVKDVVNNDVETQNLVRDFISIRPSYVPPVGTLSSVEQFLPYPQLQRGIDTGQVSEIWRNRMHWLSNDGEQEQFDEITSVVKRYLPDTTILRPRLTHDNPPVVKIEFQEEEVPFDISISGGGTRTLLNLAVFLHSSGSKCLLLDEPDAHLSGSIQRTLATELLDYAEEYNVQVFAATHAPDFISEVPVESLMWINREEDHGIPCTEVGRFLVDLGVVTSAEAIRGYGADKILFLEGSVDRTILGRFIKLSCKRNPFDDQKVIIAKLPNGKSDSKNLRSFQTLLRETFQLNVKIACIVDNDYDLDETLTDADKESEPIILSLKRKEVENYLLDSHVICKTASTSAEKRGTYLGIPPVQAPSIDEIQEELSNILNDPKIRDKVKYQVLYRYRDKLDSQLDPATRDKEADEWFSKMWNDQQWQTKNCPGKEVLRALRAWCQKRYSLSLSTTNLAKHFEECPEDINSIAQRIELYFYS